MDRYKEIEAFVQVMEHGSLAAAALHAGITPVMMGRRIDALEKRLGVPVISSNQALFWHALQLAGCVHRPQGFGSLLVDSCGRI